MGTPKQELWVDRYADRLGGAVVWTVGRAVRLRLRPHAAGPSVARRQRTRMDLQTRDRATPDVAAVPDRQSGLPLPGAGRVAPSRDFPALDALTDRFGAARLERVAAVADRDPLLALTWHFNAKPRHEIFSAAPDTLRALAATVVVFGVGGLRPGAAAAAGRAARVRAAVGAAHRRLRRRPGADPARLRLRPLPGRARRSCWSPALGLGAYAVRRRGWPALGPAASGWPTFVAAGGDVRGAGADAAGPALRGADRDRLGRPRRRRHRQVPPARLSHRDRHLPADQPDAADVAVEVPRSTTPSPPSPRSRGWRPGRCWRRWRRRCWGWPRSGFFLVARDVFRAPAAVAVVAMALAALDREALHTILNPYFNQTWGFFAMPFTLGARLVGGAAGARAPRPLRDRGAAGAVRAGAGVRLSAGGADPGRAAGRVRVARVAAQAAGRASPCSVLATCIRGRRSACCG